MSFDVTPGQPQRQSAAMTEPREIPVKPFDGNFSRKLAYQRKVAYEQLRVASERQFANKYVLPKADFLNAPKPSSGRAAQDSSAAPHTAVADEKLGLRIMRSVLETPFNAVNDRGGSTETQGKEALSAEHKDGHSNATTNNSWTSDDMMFEMDP